MPSRIAAVLRQMRQALEWIEADVDGFDLERFVGDRRARQLVERNLEVLSEASRRIPHCAKGRRTDRRPRNPLPSRPGSAARAAGRSRARDPAARLRRRGVPRQRRDAAVGVRLDGVERRGGAAGRCAVETGRGLKRPATGPVALPGGRATVRPNTDRTIGGTPDVPLTLRWRDGDKRGIGSSLGAPSTVRPAR